MPLKNFIEAAGGMALGIGLTACGSSADINVSPTQTVTPNEKAHNSSVDPRLVPPPLESPTLYPSPFFIPSLKSSTPESPPRTPTLFFMPTSTLFPTLTPPLVRPPNNHLMAGTGTSSADKTAAEVLTPSGCREIFYPDSMCYVVGFPDKDLDFVAQQFSEGRFKPSFAPQKPYLLTLQFGVYKDLAFMDPATQRVELVPRPGDQKKTSIVGKFIRLVDTIRSDKYYEGVLIGVQLPYPSNSPDPAFNGDLQKRQEAFSAELQEAYHDDPYIFFVTPQGKQLNYRDSFALSHLTRDSYRQLMQSFKAKADERLQLKFGIPMATPVPHLQ